ncbi:MAG: hypothetical protein Q8R98_24895 [Rubrivivax sp.]|nr:hypothetical protein [Rubrivivax sp.]MDP3223114.1 hypothetical protein [Rubrivivax sp.]MDP3615093.1 hypothetical protein [Rubrivivax sp.]
MFEGRLTGYSGGFQEQQALRSDNCLFIICASLQRATRHRALLLQPINPTPNTMEMSLPFVDMPLRLRFAKARAVGAQGNAASRGADKDGAPPGVPLKDRSSA